MQLVKSIIPKKIKALHQGWLRKNGLFTALLILLSCLNFQAFSQDNSPYSRYGLGDLVPPTNIPSRGMGGISAGYIDVLSVNYNNPSSFASFQAIREAKSRKLISGRTILDVGMNFENRKLIEPGNINTFTASNALFSHVYIGIPLRENWGIAFGLRPVTRISYNVLRHEGLIDPNTGQRIDSALTRFQGDGGAYLPTVGTGLSLFVKPVTRYNKETKQDSVIGTRSLNVGVNMGYMFGEKNYLTKRDLINDSVGYYGALYQTKTNFNGLHFTFGLQYKEPLAKDVFLIIGAFGSWGQKLDASQDNLRGTYVFDEDLGDLRLDSVSDSKNVKGTIQLPHSYTVGFVIHQLPIQNKRAGWLLGADFGVQNWSEYRFYGQVDSVQNRWALSVGGQYNPVPKSSWASNVSYRAGFSFGPDYIKLNNSMNVFTGSFGLGLPVALSRQAPNQITLINLALEYTKRGNNDNLLKENLFRISLGFSLSDFWFIKRKYD
jgi:hypothetical protein